MEQIGTNGMPPTHVPPGIAEGIVLIKEMVFALVIDKAIGIICPIVRRREMILRPPVAVTTIVDRRRGNHGDCKEEGDPEFHAAIISTV